MEFNNYGSHYHVFDKIFTTFEVNTALEFGLGEYSTKFFASHCQSLTSVEQNSKEWYEKVKAKVSSANCQFVFQPDPHVVYEYFDTNNQKLDLVFSDGCEMTRHIVANLAMERDIPFVVLHDTEKIWYYRWNLLDIPTKYSRFDFRSREGVGKVTTIFTNKFASILEQWLIPEHDRILQVCGSPTQPLIQLDYVSLVKKYLNGRSDITDPSSTAGIRIAGIKF